ncbi:hypothetical protein AGABI2DRAFT_116548 [Agaricus bisporus var. bisporus H97]|uniref:hypothetical protein n=1 Tax=Agaricus bisporus var. bisporus (strain H97 / ATCC MYA-4626 / FGSC 10389) TaxID=936046 RepID=UPI00029F75AB|nr:hypothetical protein AGABI2DRAFT_116548 [Agaricus bisporus var. bisporus H97]EKV49514.1 hypothetical protein AGABI2DRAFT_116548 [Agaricus bisporus var. bisporus H97]
MTIHPELEEAFNTGLSMPEVFEIFTKHHSGSKEERLNTSSYEVGPDESIHTDCAFWDDWRPLFRRLSRPVTLHTLPSEPSMNIHKALTREIISWLSDAKRRSNVYLIAEPRMPARYSYENTRAYVFANVCYDAQRFGLPMRNIPYTFWDGIDSIIAELAACYPPYRRILARKLIDNPRIFELSKRTRFRKLIHEPWKALQESQPQYITTPPVVVLCGSEFESMLDEELLNSIYESGSSQHSSSTFFTRFRYFNTSDYPALRFEHEEMFCEDEVWPSEEQMTQLIRVVSGVVGFVEVIIQFIDWEDGGGPKSHLEKFLTHMIHSPSPSDEHPYCAIDHFYMRTLSEFPPDLLSLFKQLSNIVESESCPMELFELSLACLLSLGKDELLNVLPHAYRLLVARTSRYRNLWIRSFLEDSMRSGQFYIPESESYLCTFQALLHILRHVSNPTAMLRLMVQGTQASAKTYWLTIDRLRHIAGHSFCAIRVALLSDQPLLVSTPLRHFDFRCLAHVCDKIMLNDFMKILRMLYLEKVNEPNIVRVRPVNLLDRQFIDKCDGLAEPLDFERMGLPPKNSEDKEWILLHTTSPKYVLLGFGNETVLAVLAVRESYEEWFSGVNIYTSAMLDYM